jgi:GPI ethanolamine phosphate transferase 1
MAEFSRFGFLAVAVIFHLVYLFSIFDIYFVSPIVSGMSLFKVEPSPASQTPADRLVLFVGMPSYLNHYLEILSCLNIRI